MSSSGVENAFSQTLERLSSKPGVVATLVLDRGSGAMLQSTGSFSFWSASTSPPTATSASNTTSTTASATETTSADATSSFASYIVRYVEHTRDLVQHMLLSEDDLKLLRVRTKKHELVIVPDSKFIFVVVHEISA